MRILTINCLSKEETHNMRDEINDVLKGHKNYINKDILLDTDEERNDGTENEVRVYFLKEDEESKELYSKIKDRIFS